MYNRHATVYTTNGYWTTLKDDSSEVEVCAKSDILLLYLGKNKFCEIHNKVTSVCETNTRSSKRKRSTKSISELVQAEREKQDNNNGRKVTRVRLNPTKHEHNTRGSIRKRNNNRPGRSSTTSVSYVPDMTSSDESEPNTKRRRTQVESILTTYSGPSQTRIRAQEMITRNKLQTKQNVHTKLIGTLIVSPKAKIKQETERNIKIEIKEECSKPLSKKQKERRHRRNLREMENYEWDHVHYKSGKGILCCEHAKGNKKSTTDDEHGTQGINKNNSTGHNQSVNTENVVEPTTTAEKEPTVNESNTGE